MTTKTKLTIAACLVSVGVLGRLLPHVWNFAPIVAIGLFSGSYLGRNFAFIVPVLAMFLGDIFLGFYSWQINITVYLAMALSGAIGLVIRSRKNPVSISVASISGSTLFFLMTNAAVWYFGTMYDPSIDGLIASYNAGLPFFRNALAGDLFYTGVFFGAFEAVSHLFLARRFSERQGYSKDRPLSAFTVH